jgi:hypothetical protein
MGDAFNFSPVDKVPIGTYKDKDVKYWGWIDFWNYFQKKYYETFGNSWGSVKQRNSKKKIIEQSYEYWGKDVFKAMIDWLFDNYKDYPQWSSLHIGLICGAHGWAKMIGENTKKQMELDNRWQK